MHNLFLETSACGMNSDFRFPNLMKPPFAFLWFVAPVLCPHLKLSVSYARNLSIDFKMALDLAHSLLVTLTLTRSGEERKVYFN